MLLQKLTVSSSFVSDIFFRAEVIAYCLIKLSDTKASPVFTEELEIPHYDYSILAALYTAFFSVLQRFGRIKNSFYTI